MCNGHQLLEITQGKYGNNNDLTDIFSWWGSLGCKCTLFRRLSVCFAFPFFPAFRQLSFQSNQQLIWLCSIHRAVLRLMVQRMEANYCWFDQASWAVLHSSPYCLLTHNLTRKAFFFYLHPWSKLAQTFWSHKAGMLIQQDRESGSQGDTNAEILLLFDKVLNKCNRVLMIGALSWASTHILQHACKSALMTVFMHVYE